jgi:hypothetical protein
MDTRVLSVVCLMDWNGRCGVSMQTLLCVGV